MKRLIITIFTSLIILGLPIFFWIKSKNDFLNKQTLIPRFGTSELPSAFVGKPYEADLFASVVGAKAKMEITGIGLLPELSITDCSQEYNKVGIPKPNTIVNCKLVGTLRESGQVELSFKVEARGYNNSVIQKYKLNVVP